ncbi:hypothetical protein CR513_22700, partial [Mucuna pruriens]
MMNFRLNSSAQAPTTRLLDNLNRLGRRTPEMLAQRRQNNGDPLLKGWRGMHLDKYDNTIDRDEHLANYLTQLICHPMLNILDLPKRVNPALLPANLIDSFEMLKKKFDTQYSTSQLHHLTSMALVNLQQGENESLCSFVA